MSTELFSRFKTEIDKDIPIGYLIPIHKKFCVNQQKMGLNLLNSSPIALAFWDKFGLDVYQDRRNMLWFVAIQILMSRIT